MTWMLSELSFVACGLDRLKSGTDWLDNCKAKPIKKQPKLIKIGRTENTLAQRSEGRKRVRRVVVDQKGRETTKHQWMVARRDASGCPTASALWVAAAITPPLYRLLLLSLLTLQAARVQEVSQNLITAIPKLHISTFRPRLRSRLLMHR
jgi:hypothetical protein